MALTTNPDRLGSVALFCLGLGVTPAFAPPREHGLLNQIESFNNLWQAKAWTRFHHASPNQLRRRSDRFVQAHHLKSQDRQDAAPLRSQWPPARLPIPPEPFAIFIRRTDEYGRATALGNRLQVDPHWTHRLVRCEVNLRCQRIQCFGLRRSQPAVQPLLATYKATSDIDHFAAYLHQIAMTNSTHSR